MIDPKEAAVQRLADAYIAFRKWWEQPENWEKFTYETAMVALARIAIEKGVVPAVNGLTVHIKIDGEYAPGQYTAETEIDWDAVCPGDAEGEE